MPTLYGEGDLAFRRLQLVILEQIPDQSIFAWSYLGEKPYLQPLPLQISEETNTSHGYTLLSPWRPDNLVPLLAPSPLEFRHSGHFHPISHQKYYELLANLSLTYKDGVQQYTPTPHGIRTELLLLDIHSWTPPAISSLSGEGIARWYLAILACAFSDKGEEYLLAHVCHLLVSRSPLQPLRSAFLFNISESQSEDGVHNLVILSISQIKRFRQHITLKNIYIPHPNRSYASNEVDFGPIPRDVRFSTPRRLAWSFLESQGYTVTVSEPSADETRSCRLTLSKGDDSIHIHCRGDEPDSDGHMIIMAQGSIFTHSTARSDDRTQFEVTTWFLRHQRQHTFDRERLRTAAGIEVIIRVIFRRISTADIFVFVEIKSSTSDQS